MKRLDLRLPDGLHQLLTETAAKEMRSAHSQALLILAEGLGNVAGTEIVEGTPPKEKALKAVKAVRDDCTHRASHVRTIREGEACKGCGGTTW